MKRTKKKKKRKIRNLFHIEHQITHKKIIEEDKSKKIPRKLKYKGRIDVDD